jgi:hypothetical protein
MYSPITGRRQAHIHYFETSWNLKESDCHVCMYIHVMYIHRSWLQTFPFVFINLPRLLVMLPSTYEGMSRVTRTGEFSPNGWLFALGSCMKTREVDHIFGHFIQLLGLCIDFDKLWFGLHFGWVFHILIWSPCRKNFWRKWIPALLLVVNFWKIYSPSLRSNLNVSKV